MDKIKAWFKKTFTPVDDYADIREQMAMVLEVSDIIDDDNPDLKRLYKLLSQITLIDFVWVDQLLTPMELACSKGDPWCLAALIANGADVHGTQRNKNKVVRRPIHFACMAKPSPRQLDCVLMLIQKGADFKAVDARGDMPIHLATMKGNIEVVRLLLNLGVDVDSEGSNNRGTPLVLASGIPCLEEFKKFLEDKATNRNRQDGTGQRPTEAQDESPLQAQGQVQAHAEAQAQPHDQAQAQAQAQGQAQNEAADNDAKELLAESRLASRATICKLMRLLLENGANVHKPFESFDGVTIAARLMYVDRVLILLDYGADVNNPRGPAHQCILKGILEAASEKSVQEENFFMMLSLLLAAGATITLESLENEIRPVLDNRPQLGAVKHAVFDLLQHYAAAPAPLKMLCRRRIRGLLPPDIDANIKLVPLPDILRSYLRFEDTVPREIGDD